MASYTTLRQGNSNTEENRKLQNALNGTGKYNLTVDGIYGPKTAEAVRDYQDTYGLQVDGIAGNETLGHLYGSAGNQTGTQQTQQAATPAVPDYSAYQYDPSSNATANYAQSMLEEARKGTGTPTYDYDAVQAAYDRIVNREKFSYDLNGDALYQQYRDQYTTQGQLAMMDAMGQAAALTGGYGSSYAQSVGQQAYQGYLQQLNAIVPELYGMAYDQYQQEGQDLLNQYAMVKEMADTRYGVAQDAQNAAWNAVEYWQGVADSEYSKGADNYYNAIQMGMAADETAYGRQQDERNYLLNLISAGYSPSDAELQAAGMTRSQANQLVSAYQRQAASSVGGSTGNTPTIDYKNMGYESYNEMAAAFGEIVSSQGDKALYSKLSEYAAAGYLDETTVQNLYCLYAQEESKSGELAGYSASFMTPDEWKSRTGSYAGYEAWLAQQRLYS